VTSKWTVVALETLCNISLGKTPPRGDKKFWDANRSSEIVWLSIADLPLEAMSEVFDSKEYLTPEGAALVPVVPQGTLIMSFKLSVGRTAIATIDLRTNEAIAAFNNLKEDLIDKRFLGYFLGSQDWAADQQGQEKLMGVTLNKAKLRAVQIPLPPLDEQKRIVAKLDEAMALISKELSVLNWKQREQRVLREVAIGNLFNLLKAAPQKSLESLVEPDSPVTYGVIKPGPAGTVPLVRSGDLLNGVIDVANLRTITEDVHEEYRRTALRGGEVIIGLVGVPGVAAIAPAELAGANIARQVALVRTGNQLSADFLIHWINSNVGREVLNEITQGSVQQVINLSDLRKVELPVPSMEEQQAISVRADQINSLVHLLDGSTESISKSIRELRETTLSAAFAGEL